MHSFISFDHVSEVGFNGEMMLRMEFMIGPDDVMMVRHPDKVWRRIMDPQEGIDLTLIHVVLDKILSTPTPRWAQEVIKTSPLVGWSRGPNDFHGPDPLLNHVWGMPVQEKHMITRNQRFEQYWRLMYHHGVKVFMVMIRNDIGDWGRHTFAVAVVIIQAH